MILLDTNVVSEATRPRPDSLVEQWLAGLSEAEAFICATTEAELRYGVALMPPGRRRSVVEADLDRMLTLVFADRILPFDSHAALEYATIASDRRRSGRPISIADAQIAAIARSHGAALATRNVTDFAGCGIEIIDPWTAPGNLGRA
jgi:predicted nucleic acid-binding protein